MPDFPPAAPHAADADAARRFGGLDRLYGDGARRALAAMHVVVAGIGGVGAWCAEALARSGVGALTLVDLDHVAESNINRQVHALGSTLGQAKVAAMADRIRDINPGCRIVCIDDFIGPDNVAAILSGTPGVLLDCTDQVAAKIAMILQARTAAWPLLVCGGAGGKTDPLALRAGDLSLAAHDALLGRVRQELRQRHGYPKGGTAGGKPRRRVPRMGVHCLWFEQPVVLPSAWVREASAAGRATDVAADQGSVATMAAPQGLSCAGYGSAVAITATMGMAAADWAIRQGLAA
ncbi:MAG: tRNA threonylcarbamoyladenosine dehydratase [Castellaniella sp.]|uniref:tRNA threonylcarbamoyladenosine dehydratase n=1 Tax=Castellaniella sp. TaxID=1955812 RepID=UPI002A371D68|nr:tRNA threonylcarbamoyladenosine dehydratase [Castellaniella sp.]MDY0309263.1 tRNA threonylcarbamoyladenosine dehydratase [Castellaniella sp.]